MLKKLVLENWKSFRYAELPIDPLTVLIGTNASGKSNVIDALDFLQRAVVGKDLRSALSGEATLPSIRGGVEWAARKSKESFQLEALFQRECQRDAHYKIEVQTIPIVQLNYEFLSLDSEHLLFETNLAETESPGLKIKSDYFNDKEGFRRTNSILSYIGNLYNLDAILHQGVNEITQSLENIFILNPIPTKMRDYSPLSDKLETDASNIAGVIAALSDEQKAEFESSVSTYIKDLPERDIQRVWAESVGRFRTDAMLYCQEQWKPGENIEIDARGMSDGTLRFLAILTALLTRPEGSQLVIEEVDNGLHPSRADLLLTMLKEIGEQRKIDVLVTTHNPALLDALDPEMIPFVVVVHRDSETG
ncbi:MAG TPA: AAA family ATPase [Allocoleopsis sp.]